jgi:hypothetical protein
MQFFGGIENTKKRPNERTNRRINEWRRRGGVVVVAVVVQQHTTTLAKEKRERRLKVFFLLLSVCPCVCDYI